MKLEEHTEKMKTTLDYADTSLTELRQECEKVGTTIGAYGSASFSKPKFMYDDSVKNAIVGYSQQLCNASERLYKSLTEINSAISSIVEEDFSSQIEAGKRQLEQIGDFAHALTRLGENVETEVETIIAQLCGCIDTGTLSKYGKNSRVEDVKKRRGDADIDRWLKATDEVGQAYIANVFTYCTRTPDDEDYGKADKRKMYLLKDIEGNLDGYKVGDDCSSFVYACLIQAGYISEDDIMSWAPSSSHYLPDGSMDEILKDAGFVWYGKDELKSEDIQKGDILVKDGHVEIFDRYENDVEYAYTWGSIYRDEPARKDNTIYNIWDRYEGVWRYEGK